MGQPSARQVLFQYHIKEAGIAMFLIAGRAPRGINMERRKFLRRSMAGGMAAAKVMFRRAGARRLGYRSLARELLRFRWRCRDGLGVGLALDAHIDGEDANRCSRLVGPVVRPVHRFEEAVAGFVDLDALVAVVDR